MKDETNHGVLVVGHGSRRSEANQDVRNVTRLIGEVGGFPIIETAFLEIESPDINSGFDRLVRRGASSITVHPYFLSPGRHTRGDLPVKVAEASAGHAGIDYRITEPLAAHHLVVEASLERIRETLRTTPHKFPSSRSSMQRSAEKGKVYLVGAGPGDVGLLTVRAQELLRSCDVVMYDYLVSREALEIIPAKTELVYVGKIGCGRQTPQSRINGMIIESALLGKSVVRLKGGDPFIFGRGGEEAEALAEAGVQFEVVPGISSAFAAAAYAGIPLTHRGISSSVAVVTGVRKRGGDIEGTGSPVAGVSADTLVILMGLTNLRQIASDLITAGRSADTPVAVVQWASYKQQSTVTATLRTIADMVENARLQAPAVIIVGDVVELRERLNWFEPELAGARGMKKLELAAAASF